MVLTDLQPGKRATITNISMMSDILKQRLIDMGVHEGEEVCVKCTMPFGGPVMVEVAGQCICLRRKEAACIGVE
ncbi:ferrous iron transport protein A [Anoxybacillus voinovskiensis]|uniref:Ferrous iron transport protein A n=1 Tax=Anoxybacteroides voinovskiense TaxID=230470 RepID=A0A840DL00_9BACL|nr:MULTISPECIES: FeoA family protein [Anoxybacillus]MBB4072383.1 ferrous iron transport protein A [Anoxybacillus voinovskiensis]MCZ0755771.1 FeoA family protein [Anoxybacillus sp. J5B_2022]GGJ58335.1 iron transporter FeoA [Anoxybacillus voinovskiensis]